MGKEPKICAICGKKYSPIRDTQKFCSTACRGKSHQNRVSVECSFCGNTYLKRKVHVNKVNFCSPSCNKSYRSNLMLGNTHMLGHKHSPESKAKIGMATRRLFKTEEYVSSWSKGMTSLPNKLERHFDSITPKNVKYTGDGKFFLTFKDGTVKNPDFVIEHSRKVIEVYGDYWHRNDNPEDIVKAYIEIGFDCLVVWEREIHENEELILARVKKFIDKPEKGRK